MGYVVSIGLQNPELGILFQLNILLLRYFMSKSGKSTTFFLFSSLQGREMDRII